MKWTKAQSEAIKDQKQNTLVSAGAGSGKTAVLTERVISLLKEGHSLKEFLIITFTNLATDEMKDRIRAAIHKAIREETDELKKKHLQNEEILLETAQIMTFDAYALSVVKKYHFQLGIKKGIKNGDDAIFRVRAISIVNKLLSGRYNNMDPDLIDLVSKYCFKDDDNLVDLIVRLYKLADKSLEPIAYLDSFVSKHFDDHYYAKLEQRAFDYVKELKQETKAIIDSSNLPVQFHNDFSSNCKDFVDNLFAPFLAASDFDSAVSLFPSMDTLPVLRKDKIEAYAEFRRQMVKLYNARVKPLPPSFESIKDELESHKKEVEFIIQITKELVLEMTAFKQKAGVYSFDDIAKMAYLAIRDNEDVRNDIKNSLSYIMVDEYQDTSLLQDETLALIANNNLYMVGDIKQSIYAFRNARCDLFQKKYDDYSNGKGGMVINMNENFRSRKEVIEDINALFSSLMDKEFGGADYRKEHIIKAGSASRYDGAGSVSSTRHSEFLLYGLKKKNSPTDQAEIEAHSIARDIINKINNKYQVVDRSKGEFSLRDCRYSDFCILMDRTTEFPVYRDVFKEYQLPLFIEADEDFTKNDMVRIISSLLHFLDNVMKETSFSYDDKDKEKKEKGITFRHYFVSLARSFIFSYSDQKIYEIAMSNAYEKDPLFLFFKDFVEANRNLPLHVLIRKAIEELHIKEKCITLKESKQNGLYIDTLLNLFNGMGDLHYGFDDIFEFLDNIEKAKIKIKLTSQPSTRDEVRLMDIHKSKGLEFPIVYFSGLHKVFNREEFKNEFYLNDEFGFVFLSASEDHEAEAAFVKSLYKAFAIKEDISEKIRFFYVDLTRTREKMVFLIRDEDYENKKIKEAEATIQKEYLDYVNNKTSFDEILKLYQCGKINSYALALLCFHNEITLPLSFRYLSRNRIMNDVETLNYYEDKDLHDKERADRFCKNSSDPSTVEAKALLEYRKHEISLVEFYFILQKLDKVPKNYDKYFNSPTIPLLMEEGNEIVEQELRVSTADPDEILKKKEAFILGSDGMLTDREQATKMIDFLQAFPKDQEKELTLTELELDAPKPLINLVPEASIKILIKDQKRPYEERPHKKSSEPLKLFSDSKALRKGTMLHEAMEVIDFVKPDYASLGDKHLAFIAKRFLEQGFMKDVSQASIFKEYSFIQLINDEEKEGIIDLMLVYENRVVIVDYKTYDLSDDEYQKQLMSYAQFAYKTFNRPVDTILYSLEGGFSTQGPSLK